MASRTDVRATLNCSDSARSEGTRAPGSNEPFVIRSRSWSRICALSVSRVTGSNDIGAAASIVRSAMVC